MTVAINHQLLNNIQECDVIHNFNKIEKKELRAFTLRHATNVVDTYIAISDDKLSREQIRRANRKPRKITRKTVEAREFMGIY
jgi:hypothetical protein